MNEPDQAGVIAQLLAENAMLHKTLRDAPAREFQIASAINALMDELTRLGPEVTARVVTHVVGRYMKSGELFFEHQFRDRRPKPAPTPEKPAEPTKVSHRELPKTETCSICAAGPFTRPGYSLHLWRRHNIKMTEHNQEAQS
jgi:hypothetical protein